MKHTRLRTIPINFDRSPPSCLGSQHARGWIIFFSGTSTLLPCNLAAVIQSTWMRGEGCSAATRNLNLNSLRQQMFRTSGDSGDHFGSDSETSFWNRGSPRSSSKSGSSRNHAGVIGPSYGIVNRCAKMEIARSFWPKRAAIFARV